MGPRAPAAIGASPGGPVGPAHRATPRRRSGRSRRPVRRADRPRRPEGRPVGPGRARGRAPRPRWPGGAARGGHGCARTGGRRWTGRRTGSRPRRGAQGPASRTDGGRAGGGPAPALMPARPSRPAPRSRLTSTVSAWSSMVWPVAAPSGRARRRASRARASRFGPGPTSTAQRPEPAPRGGLRLRPRRRPRAADPGRSPWSTWTAVTSHPAATASTSSARESAPPETAQVTTAPGAGERAPAKQLRHARDEGGARRSVTGVGHHPVARRAGPMRATQVSGWRISSMVGSISGPSHTRASRSGPPEASTAR